MGPRVSVIIATYNWSGALACALRSVLAQTEQDFEVRVVGDACTDDSAQVVAAFRDPRLIWTNLDRNCGSQWGPNNHGLSAARGEWIAYLGHDDLWAPEHLQSVIAAAEAAGTDTGVGGMVLYGPPGEGIASVAGVPGPEGWSDDDFTPPSGMVHRHALVDRIGPWKDATALREPVDNDFFRRARAAGGVAANRAFTVFKFTAAMRRNAYQLRSTAEQEAQLFRLTADGPALAAELADLYVQAQAGVFPRVKMRDAAGLAPGDIHRWNRLFKGVDPRFAEGEIREATQPLRFSLDTQPANREWTVDEEMAPWGLFRWTGPTLRSVIELPIRPDRPLAFTVHILGAVPPDWRETLAFEVHGRPTPHALSSTDQGTWMLTATAPARPAGEGPPYLQIAIAGVRAARPADIGLHKDTRRLGVAVNWVEVAPA